MRKMIKSVWNPYSTSNFWWMYLLFSSVFYWSLTIRTNFENKWFHIFAWLNTVGLVSELLRLSIVKNIDQKDEE